MNVIARKALQRADSPTYTHEMAISGEIFKYQDYRAFLRDYLKAEKKRRPSFSYSVWARRLGIKSPSTLAMVLKGQRHPGPALITSLNRFFKFRKKEAEYFEDLVFVEKNKSTPRRALTLVDRLQKTKSAVTLEEQNFAAISHWYHYVIREMSHFENQTATPESLQKRMLFPVGLEEIRQGLDTLLQLGLIEVDKAGRLKTTQNTVDTSADVKSLALQNFHEQMLEISKQGLKQFAPHEREITGVTLAMNREKLPMAKELLRNFVMQFMDLLENENADSVFHLELALTPMARKGEKT